MVSSALSVECSGYSIAGAQAMGDLRSWVRVSREEGFEDSGFGGGDTHCVRVDGDRDGDGVGFMS